MTKDKTVTMSRALEILEEINAAANRQACFEVQRLTDELRSLLAAPVVERQPYGYWICPKGNPKLGSFHHEVLDTTEQYCEVTPLFASPPAPVAVDERAEFENYYRDRIMGNRTGVRFLRSSSGAYLDREVVEMWSGWQARACLDKVKELNQ